jgi:hypothetical protein
MKAPDRRLLRHGLTLGFLAILSVLANLSVAKGGDPAGARAIAAYLKAEPGLIEKFAITIVRGRRDQPPSRPRRESSKVSPATTTFPRP